MSGFILRAVPDIVPAGRHKGYLANVIFFATEATRRIVGSPQTLIDMFRLSPNSWAGQRRSIFTQSFAVEKTRLFPVNGRWNFSTGPHS